MPTFEEEELIQQCNDLRKQVAELKEENHDLKNGLHEIICRISLSPEEKDFVRGKCDKTCPLLAKLGVAGKVLG